MDLPTWLTPESIEDLTTRIVLVLIIFGLITERIVPGKRVEKLDDALNKLTKGLDMANKINERALELLGERRSGRREKDSR